MSERAEAFGQSEAFLKLQERISRAARTDRPVVLIGERGTGKELAADRLHKLSARWRGAYVTLNCGALTPTLIESELFGHDAGAFTGAVRRRKGRFELASGGSLFLDEVANIPLTAQEKILRAVEYGQFERVGGMETLRVDARLIAAANADLRRLAREGRFRDDLLDRLSFEVIVLPPLRDRREDIMILARHFAQRMAMELRGDDATKGTGAGVVVFTERAERALLDHAWPGNIRELKNVVERMVYRIEASADGVTLIDEVVFDPFESAWGSLEREMPAMMRSETERGREEKDERDAKGQGCEGIGSELERLPLKDAVEKLEKWRMERALASAKYNQRRAADLLGLNYNQFRALYRKHTSS